MGLFITLHQQFCFALRYYTTARPSGLNAVVLAVKIGVSSPPTPALFGSTTHGWQTDPSVKLRIRYQNIGGMPCFLHYTTCRSLPGTWYITAVGGHQPWGCLSGCAYHFSRRSVRVGWEALRTVWQLLERKSRTTIRGCRCCSLLQTRPRIEVLLYLFGGATIASTIVLCDWQTSSNIATEDVPNINHRIANITYHSVPKYNHHSFMNN